MSDEDDTASDWEAVGADLASVMPPATKARKRSAKPASEQWTPRSIVVVVCKECGGLVRSHPTVCSPHALEGADWLARKPGHLQQTYGRYLRDVRDVIRIGA